MLLLRPASWLALLTRTFTFELALAGSPRANVEYDYVGKQSTPTTGLSPASPTALWAAGHRLILPLFQVAILSTQHAGRSRRAGTGPAHLIARARTFPLPQFYNMPIVLIPSAAVVALSESKTQMDFDSGDGWVISEDYAMRVLSPPVDNARLRLAAKFHSDAAAELPTNHEESSSILFAKSFPSRCRGDLGVNHGARNAGPFWCLWDSV